ncbi:MAG: 4-(cytidine 5'-diphospho)-2-C-methyl-D-erythritol kinase [Bacteroidota bacterium]
MICFPNCKINIGLNVVEKRKDGFHNIETVFYPVGLCDAFEIVESKKLSIKFSGIKIKGNTNDNLCIKAYNLIAENYNIPPVNIFLHKAIPAGAGLGGGSSDAAHMLFLINKMFSLNISKEKLFHFASLLGSDCSFFMNNIPAFAHGRGDITENISLNLKGYHILIVKPNFEISTAKAYSLIKPALSKYSLKEISLKNIKEWGNLAVNDFEVPVSKEFPEIIKIKDRLYKSGAVYASMTGSGSAVYGIFEAEPEIPSVFEKHFTWKGLI